MKQVELEIRGPLSEELIFPPLQKRIRGEFNFMHDRDPQAAVEAAKWPGPVPGKRLGIDNDGVGYIHESLNDPENIAFKKKIEKAGWTIAEDETFPDIDTTTWLFWMILVVAAGYAEVVKGSLPDKVNGKVRTNFIINDPPPGATDKLTVAIEKQSALFEKLLEKMSK